MTGAAADPVLAPAEAQSGALHPSSCDAMRRDQQQVAAMREPRRPPAETSPPGSGPPLAGALARLPYHEVWAVDFEFQAPDGERPRVVCMVARELRSGRLVRLWRDELGNTPPFRTDESALFVAYYSSAEWGCHLELGWSLPGHILDLFAEFRAATNGLATPMGKGLLGGRYMAAAARMEWNGVPIDTASLTRIRAGWREIKTRLIEEIDAYYGVYVGAGFKAERFGAYLAAMGIPWPRLPSGALALDRDTFKEMARAYPVLEPLKELRSTLGEMRLEALAVGSDGRNRCLLSALRSRTGRNQPSNTRFIFGPATWLRSLIRPEPGMALAYVDFSSQEMGIAAALSGDPVLIDAYRSGDVYLSFAVQAGLAPAGATKASHGEIRDRCKAVVLGTLYGMGPEGLARRIGRPPCEARELLELHRRTYPRFWSWSEAAVTSFALTGRVETVFGWPLHAGPDWNARSVMNFPMQANGAEMLRLACCLATERGLAVCAPVHDAILIEAPAAEIEDAVAELQACMREASRVVLGGLELGSDAKIVRWPDRYSDKRGEAMWVTVMRLLNEAAEGGETVAAG